MPKKQCLALVVGCLAGSAAVTASADDLHVLGHVKSHKLDILAEGGQAWCAPHLRLHMVLQPDSPDVARQTALPGIMSKLAKPISIDCPSATDATLTVETGSRTLSSYQASASNGWAFTAVVPPTPAPNPAMAEAAEPAPQAAHQAPPPGQPIQPAPLPAANTPALPSALGTPGPLDVRDAKQAAVAFVKAVDAGDIATARAVSVGNDGDYMRLQALCDRVRAEARLQASFTRYFPKEDYTSSGFPAPKNWHPETIQMAQSNPVSTEKTVSLQDETKTMKIKLSKASGAWKIVVAGVEGLEDPSTEQPPLGIDPPKYRSVMAAVPPDDAYPAANANDIALGIEAGLYTNGSEAAQAYAQDNVASGLIFLKMLAFPVFDLPAQLTDTTKSSASPEEAASLRAFVQRYQNALYDGDSTTIRALTSAGSEAGAMFLQAVIGYRKALINLDRAFRGTFAPENGDAAESVKLAHDWYLATFLLGPGKLSAPGIGVPTGNILPYATIAKRYIFSTSAAPLSASMSILLKAYFKDVPEWREGRLLEVPPKSPVLGTQSERYFTAIQIDDNIHFVHDGDTWKVAFVRQTDRPARDSILQIRYGLFNVLHLCGATDAKEAIPLLIDATSAIANTTALIKSGHLSERKDVFAALDKLGDTVDAAMKQGAIARNQSAIDSFLAGNRDPITAENPMLGKWRDINDPGLEKYTGMADDIQAAFVSENGGQNPAHFKLVARNEVELFSNLPLTDIKAEDGGQVCYFADQNHMFCPNFNYRRSGYYIRLGTGKP